MWPMRFPARYAPFIADAVFRAISETRLDATFRADSDPAIRKFAGVPDALINDKNCGDATVELSFVGVQSARAKGALAQPEPRGEGVAA